MYGKSHQIRSELAGVPNPIEGEPAADTSVQQELGETAVDSQNIHVEYEHAINAIGGAEISSEERSIDQLSKLVSVTHELAGKFPEFAGMTIFGSVARGEARDNSDVDTVTFFEVSGGDSTRPVHKAAAGVNMHIFGASVEAEYRNSVRNAFKEEAVMNPDQADIIVLPISTEIVEEEVEDLLAAAAAYDPKSEDGFTWSVPRNIRTLFNMPVVDGRLKKYQAQVVDTLARSEYGKLAWGMLAFKVRYFEIGREREDDWAEYERRLSFQPVPMKLSEAQRLHNSQLVSA